MGEKNREKSALDWLERNKEYLLEVGYYSGPEVITRGRWHMIIGGISCQAETFLELIEKAQTEDG